MLILILCFAAQTAAAAVTGFRSHGLVKRQDTTSISTAVQAALDFEYSTWSNGSVYDEDFYTVPSGCGDEPAGSLLKVQTGFSPTNYTIPPGLSLSRIIFQSRRLNGSLVPASAFILWPYTPRKEHDGFPVIGYAHGTSGVQANCAPSHLQNLWQHFLAPYPLAYQGYVVVAPDYAGQGVYADAEGRHIVHEYIASPAGANDVTYAVQAAQKAFPELSKRYVVMGHSQGGGVAWSAAQRQVKQPVKGYLGSVAVAPITKYVDIDAMATATGYPSYVALLAAQGVTGLYPDFKAEDVSTEAGKSFLSSLRQTGGCSSTFVALLQEVDTSQSALLPGAIEDPRVQDYLNRSANGGEKISGPMLVIQGGADNTVPPNTTTQAVAETVKKYPKSQIDFELFPDLDHVPSLEASQLKWQAWIADRFSGKLAKPYKATTKAFHNRPAVFLQPALNWWIALADKLYQTP